MSDTLRAPIFLGLLGVAFLLGSFALASAQMQDMMGMMGSHEYKVDITYSPDPVVVGVKTTFTFAVYNKTSGKPVTGGLIWNHLAPGFGSMMPMLKAPGGIEVNPGVYKVEVVFNRTGEYAFHFHIFPLINGKRVGMMEPGFGHHDFDIRVLSGAFGTTTAKPGEYAEKAVPLDYKLLVLGSSVAALATATVVARRKRRLRILLGVALIGTVALLSMQYFYTPPSQAPAIEVGKPAVIWVAAGSSYPYEGRNFTPQVAKVVIGKNNTVTWRNGDVSGHTISDESGEFGSPLINPGKEWTYTFSRPGVYEYFCRPHPWMRGTITVEAGAGQG